MRLRTQTFALQRLAYSQPEAAEVAGVGLSQIKEALQCGELAEVEFPGSRRKVILHSDLRQYLLRNRVFRGSGGDHTGKIPPADTSLPAALPTEKAPTNRRRRGQPPSIRHDGSPPMTRFRQGKGRIRAP
jgi:hypothetical protein